MNFVSLFCCCKPSSYASVPDDAALLTSKRELSSDDVENYFSDHPADLPNHQVVEKLQKLVTLCRNVGPEKSKCPDTDAAGNMGYLLPFGALGRPGKEANLAQIESSGLYDLYRAAEWYLPEAKETDELGVPNPRRQAALEFVDAVKDMVRNGLAG